MMEFIDNPCDSQELFQPLAASGILHITVFNVGEGDTIATQYLGTGKQAALGIGWPQLLALGAFISGTPDQKWQSHVFSQPGHGFLLPKIGVRQFNHHPLTA